MILYNVVIIILALCYVPRYLVSKRRRKLFLSRMGLRLPQKLTEPKKLIWLHAISLGEMRSSKYLILKLREKFPDALIYISAVTETGFEEAKTIPGIDHVFIMPFDFPWNMSRLFKRLRPHSLILIETDFWFNLAKSAKKYGANLLLVSAKISKRSTRRFQYVSDFTRKLFSFFDVICVQNTAYKRRFEEIGVDPKKIVITGNLKYDQETPLLKAKELKSWKEKLGLFKEDSIITIASTHAPEEKKIIREMKKIWETDLSLKILLAPRHPERFVHVANTLRSEKVPFIELSKIDQKNHTEKVILVDRMGFLPICYQVSDFAIMGGSYTPKVGGHNILEPNFYSLPVFFGPFMHTQADLKEMVLYAKSGEHLQLNDYAEFIIPFLTDLDKKKEMGTNAKALIKTLKGRLNVTLDTILPHLEKKTCD